MGDILLFYVPFSENNDQDSLCRGVCFGKEGGTAMQKGRRQQKNEDRKRLSDSQNFITDQRLIGRLIRLSSIGREDTVVEIGTGKGHLTEEMCRRGGIVYSVELDRKLYEGTKKKLEGYANLHLIHGDFLTYSLPARGDYKVFANIPYFITTQIVEKLTNAPNPPKEIWLVMEKGAAKRFMGAGKETKKSLLLKVKWDMKILYHFRREDFHPKPSVDSVLLYFAKKKTPDLNRSEYEEFKRFIDHSMKFGISGRHGLLTRRQAAIALKQAGQPHAHEDGVTLYIQWLCLFRCYLQFNKR